MIFVAGDVARYHGDVAGNQASIILAGDQVTVYHGNAEPEDEVYVTLDSDSAPVAVDPSDLQWLSGKP